MRSTKKKGRGGEGEEEERGRREIEMSCGELVRGRAAERRKRRRNRIINRERE